MRGPVDRWLVLGPEAENDEDAGRQAPGQEGSQPWPWPLPRPPGRRPEPLAEPEARAERIREATLKEEMRAWKKGR